jgi:hypothetical protein
VLVDPGEEAGPGDRGAPARGGGAHGIRLRDNRLCNCGFSVRSRSLIRCERSP